MNETETAGAVTNDKPAFSRIGWALFAILGIATAIQAAVAALAHVFEPWLYDTSWFKWAMTFVPLYFIAIPIGYGILKPMPKLLVPQQKLGFGRLMGFLAMSFAVMYIGNIVGSLVNLGISSLKDTETINPVAELLEGSGFLIELLVVVTVAPILEELIFRKLLIDRIRVYGEATAILVSGLTFGLFHGNLSQFFYAFGLGSLFAYIYLRTGRLRYTVILHAIINGFAVLQVQLVLKNGGMSALQDMSGKDPEEMMSLIQANLPQLITVGIMGLVVIGLFITGVILLIKKRKDAVLFTAPMELPKGTRFKTVFLNWGMGLFVLLSLGIIVLYSAIAL